MNSPVQPSQRPELASIPTFITLERVPYSYVVLHSLAIRGHKDTRHGGIAIVDEQRILRGIAAFVVNRNQLAVQSCAFG